MTTAVDRARPRIPVAHVALEPSWEALSGGDGHGLPVLELDGEVLGTADHHGPPVRLHRAHAALDRSPT